MTKCSRIIIANEYFDFLHFLALLFKYIAISNSNLGFLKLMLDSEKYVWFCDNWSICDNENEIQIFNLIVDIKIINSFNSLIKELLIL